MNLREQLIKLSEVITCSEEYKYEKITDVYFRQINTKEGEVLGKLAMKKDAEGFTSKILVKLLCDKDGERVFKDSDVGTIEKLPSKLTSEMLKDALIYNKMMPEAVDIAVKN